MRKLLLATVAGLVASVGVASAQTAPTTMMSNDKATVPTQPGTVVIRLNGRVNAYAATFANGSAGNNNSVPNGAPPTNGKLQNYDFGTYARLFPGFDAIAANGMKYGAAMEIRTVQGAQQYAADLYIQRMYGYLGTDKVGTFRFGWADGPASLMLTGTQESFNDGGWDGDMPGFLAGGLNYSIRGGNLPLWPVLADYGFLYATNKLVYMSPNFSGFDFGASFSPNSKGPDLGSQCSNNVASAACGGVTSTSAVLNGTLVSGVPYPLERRVNDADVAARYRGTFGAVGLAVYGDYLASGYTRDASTPTIGQGYSGLSVFSGGVEVTVGGLEFGGWGQYGDYNMDDNQFLKPTGSKNGSAYVVGAQYTFGPVVGGVQFFDSWDAGNQIAANNTTVGAINEYGVATGGTYTLAPGVSIYLSYLWGMRKEAGWDFIDNGGQAGNLHNKTFAQLIGTGLQFTW